MTLLRGPATALLLAVLALAALPGADAPDGSDAPETAADGAVVDGLSASIGTTLAVPRLNAPFPLLIAVTARGQGVREGSFEIVVASGGATRFTWRGEPLVLASGRRISAVLLPAIASENSADEVTLTLNWCEGERRLPLATRTLLMTLGREHLVTLGLCLPLTAPDEERRQLVRLALERYAPDPARQATAVVDPGETSLPIGEPGLQPGRSSGLRTMLARLKCEDLPEAALGWCAYDAVVIAGDALATVTARQVQALERWLRGGGSACLMSDGHVAPALADLLQRAAQDSADAPLVARYLATGVADDPPAAHARLTLGLGRLVVTAWPGAGRNDDLQWRRSAAFLWQARAEQALVLADHPRWDGERFAEVNLQDNRQGDGPIDPDLPFADRPLDLRDQLIDLLWPEKVEVIPFSFILLLFLLFVLMIGPGDWFLLGWLRARRFTWVLFPLVAIGCTAFTVWLSRQYLGASDRFQHLQIIDLASDGTQLRRNHLELLFSGSSKAVETQVQDALWSPLGSGSGLRQMYRGRYAPRSRDVDPASPFYHGTLPGQYTVAQEVAQWTPMLRRELTFAPCELPWQVPVAAIVGHADLADTCAAWLRDTGRRSAVVVLRAGRIVATYGDAGVLQRRSTDRDARPVESDLHARSDWLTALCSHPQQGWFALAASRAPSGGPTCDDIAVCDPSDAQQVLVVFAAWRDDTLWLVRCRYATDRPRSGQSSL